jgi:hypothetical protein
MKQSVAAAGLATPQQSRIPKVISQVSDTKPPYKTTKSDGGAMNPEVLEFRVTINKQEQLSIFPIMGSITENCQPSRAKLVHVAAEQRYTEIELVGGNRRRQGRRLSPGRTATAALGGWSGSLSPGVSGRLAGRGPREPAWAVVCATRRRSRPRRPPCRRCGRGPAGGTSRGWCGRSPSRAAGRPTPSCRRWYGRR